MIYAKVKNIIDRWDPIGLVGIDPEHDHYRFEINEIIKLLQSNYSTPEELAKHVDSIFIEYFDDEHSLNTHCVSSCYYDLVPEQSGLSRLHRWWKTVDLEL
ncbi:hypothetical protein EMIT07CA2_60022 [Brevibacillus sp. IT-7CA2]|uniref:DUF1871 family protein n=1 Tax=Brevibacillus sp. IT-7CA2 TaxID=3026436 RepID=UPI0039E17E92